MAVISVAVADRYTFNVIFKYTSQIAPSTNDTSKSRMEQSQHSAIALLHVFASKTVNFNWLSSVKLGLIKYIIITDHYYRL